MAVCCQNLPPDALSSYSAPSMLVGELFKKFGLFLNTGVYLLYSVEVCTTISVVDSMPSTTEIIVMHTSTLYSRCM